MNAVTRPYKRLIIRDTKRLINFVIESVPYSASCISFYNFLRKVLAFKLYIDLTVLFCSKNASSWIVKLKGILSCGRTYQICLAYKCCLSEHTLSENKKFNIFSCEFFVSKPVLRVRSKLNKFS